MHHKVAQTKLICC